MRLLFVGMDGRARVSRANAVKFLEDGFQRTDKHDERDADIEGPVIVAHVFRSRGGRRLTVEVPRGYDMKGAQRQLLQEGWLDITDCTVRAESLY